MTALMQDEAKCCLSIDATNTLLVQLPSAPLDSTRTVVRGRFRSASRFFSEFRTNNTAQALSAPAAAVSITVTAKPLLTPEAIALRVLGAIASVMGIAVRPDQPLVEAGLDSHSINLIQVRYLVHASRVPTQATDAYCYFCYIAGPGGVIES